VALAGGATTGLGQKGAACRAPRATIFVGVAPGSAGFAAPRSLTGALCGLRSVVCAAVIRQFANRPLNLH
jgi:hypothetical protein